MRGREPHVDLSYMTGPRVSHRHSLMPGQLPSEPGFSSQLPTPKGTKRPASTLSVSQSPLEVGFLLVMFIFIFYFAFIYKGEPLESKLSFP